MRKEEILIIGPEDLYDSKNVTDRDMNTSSRPLRREVIDELMKANTAIFVTDAKHRHLTSKIIKNRYF